MLLFCAYGSYKEKLAKLYLRFVKAGLFLRWYKEFVGMGMARRVQDRAGMISPTHMIEVRDHSRSLHLDGKFLDVILLWSLFLGCSSLVFLVEMARGKQYSFLYTSKIMVNVGIPWS